MSSGGKRTGAGRKTGSLSEDSIKMREKLRLLRSRIYKDEVLRDLFNSAMILARGSYSLWCQKYDDKHKKIGRAYQIKDDNTFDSYLNGELENTSHEYYMMRKDRADIRAISVMLDRGFGKPETNVNLGSGEDSDPINISFTKIYEGKKPKDNDPKLTLKDSKKVTKTLPKVKKTTKK